MKTLITLFISNLSNIKLRCARASASASATLYHQVKVSYYSTLVFSPENNLNIRKPNVFQKSKNKIKFFTVPFNELTEFEFIKLLQLNLKVDTEYTILFQYASYEQGIHFMLGPQTGIPVRETHDLNFYRLLSEHYLENLEILMDRYNIENPDFIVIYLKELILEETLKKVDPISQIALSKGLLRLGKTKQFFSTNILPLSKAEKNFGSLLEDKLQIEYLKKLFEKIQSRSVSELSTTHNSKTSDVLQHGDAYKSPIYYSINEVLCGGYEQWSYDFSNNLSNTIYINNLIAG
jgi:hypothetical protein